MICFYRNFHTCQANLQLALKPPSSGRKHCHVWHDHGCICHVNSAADKPITLYIVLLLTLFFHFYSPFEMFLWLFFPLCLIFFSPPQIFFSTKRFICFIFLRDALSFKDSQLMLSQTNTRFSFVPILIIFLMSWIKIQICLSSKGRCCQRPFNFTMSMT